MSPQQSHYETFELTIGPLSPTGYPLSVTGSPGGDGAGICRLELDGELVDALAAIDSNNVDAGFLADIGAFLFEELFTGDIGELYRASMGAVRGQESRLRLRLHINAPELAALPWEYLHDPAEEHFFATSSETVLVRYVPVRLPARPTKVELPLRILHLIANPSDAPQLNLAQERQIMESALQQWIDDGRIQLEIVEKATVANVTEAMRRATPHVVHFSGHGFFENDTAYIVLEDDHGKAAPVDEKTFREFFSGSKETRLAVLNACQSATLSTAKPLVGIAPQLLQRQLSAVVAMQYPISDQASLIFTREFYRSLAHGYPVDAAISEARKGIYLETGGQSREWGTPVLFMRAKNGVLFAIDEPEKAAIEIPPPPEPRRPPIPENFVGRKNELTELGSHLHTQGSVVISGMAGVGKTAIAASLAKENGEPNKTFWHTFREDEGIEVIIWQLAGFLAWHGRSDLWKMLQTTAMTGGKPPPPDILFDYLFQLIRREEYLICFDDFHLVDEDPRSDKLVERLRPAVRAKEIRIIFTSRRVPNFVDTLYTQSLQGLSYADTKDLLSKQGQTLADGLVKELHERTEGNAELLTLTIHALQKAKDPAHLLENLVEAGNVERYLLKQIDKELSEEDRDVMNGVAALLGYPGTRDAIEEVLNGTNARRQLTYLTNRYLLQQFEGEAAREYGQHAIVQAFYYDLLSRRERQAMHARAGEYYEREEADLLKAALHFERAGEYERAAQLATQDVWAVINSGRARALRNLLERFNQSQLEDSLFANVQIVRGQILSLLGEKPAALQLYNRALTLLATEPESPQFNLQKAIIYHDLGDLLQYDEPQVAYEHLQNGITLFEQKELSPKATKQLAALYIKFSSIQIALNKYQDAKQSIQQGLDLAGDSPSQLYVQAMINLGNIDFYRGDIAKSLFHAEQGLAVSKQLHDDYRTTTILSNLCAYKFISGDWSGAIEEGQNALNAAIHIDSTLLQARLNLNMGIMLTKSGSFDDARPHFERCLFLTKAHDLTEIRILVLASSADLDVRRGRFDDALEQLAEAETLATELTSEWALPEILRIRAESKLCIGNVAEALIDVEMSIEIATRLNMSLEEGMSQRVLGEALYADGQDIAGFTAFERGIALLDAEDPYETARTYLSWGRMLDKPNELRRYQNLFQIAESIFVRLGAQHELDILQQL